MTETHSNLGLKTAYVAFLLVSWATTGQGLSVFLPLPFAFLLSAALSIGMGALAPRIVPRWGHTMDSVLSLLLYATMATASIIFAGAFYFQTFSGTALERQRVDDAEQALLKSLGQLRQHYQILADKLDELADYSRQRAVEEEREGGTCAGSRGAGIGPSWAMRQWQGQEFQRAAVEFRRIQNELERQIEAVYAVVENADRPLTAKQKDLQRLAVLLENYNQRPDVQQLLDELRAQADYQQNGYPRNDRYCYRGVCFGGRACRDGRLGTLVADIQALGLPHAQIPTIERYEATNLQQNIKLVIDLWSYTLGFSDEAPKIRTGSFFPLAVGAAADLCIFLLGLLIGKNRRAHPASRLDPSRLNLLIERLEDIRSHYPEVFPEQQLPRVPAGSVDDRLHRIQQMLDIVAHPVGMDKVILLPHNTEAVLKSKRGNKLGNRSERLLEAVIEVVNALSRFRLLGEPYERLRNRYTTYCGYDRNSVASRYELKPGSVQYFSVFIVAPELMLEATALTQADLPLPFHLALQRRLLRRIHPAWFELEERVLTEGCDAISPETLAGALLARTEDVRRHAPSIESPPEDSEYTPEPPSKSGEKASELSPKSGEDAPSLPELEATVTLYPQLFALDRCLERLLLDDDHGLHQDLEERPQNHRFPLVRHLRPYRRFRLGPESYAALQELVDSDGRQ